MMDDALESPGSSCRRRQHIAGETLSEDLPAAQHGVAPKPTRMAMATLTAVSGADFLQYLYAQAQQATE